MVTGQDSEIKSFIRDYSPETDIIIVSFFEDRRTSTPKKRIDDNALSIVERGDAILRRARIRYKDIWPLSSTIVPFSHDLKGRGNYKFREPIQPSKFEEIPVCFAMAPEIPSRCMAIADMFGRSSCMDAFCLSRARSNNQVIFSETEEPKCEWTEKHAELVSLIQIWDILDETFMHFSSPEEFRSLWEKDRGIYIRLWIHLHEFHQYPLCPTPMGDPVSDKSYLFL